MMAVYLDYQSTTPLDPRVEEAMRPYHSELFANPSSTHEFGRGVKRDLENARISIAVNFNAQQDEIVFTSGATESLNLVLQGLIRKKVNCKIITQTTEHSAVLQACQYLENIGAEVTYLPVGADGILDVSTLATVITNQTDLVCVMHANNEIGSIQPIKAIGELCKKNNVAFLVDASQTAGKIAIDVQDCHIDFMAISSHKLYGPKGVGALFIRQDQQSKIKPILYGGGQEFGLRSGTLNIPGIIGLSKALEISCNEFEEENDRILKLRTLLFDKLNKELSGICVNGNMENRLPGNLSITFSNVSNDVLINQLGNIIISKGSACNSTKTDGSHVLKAIGLHSDEIESTIRIGIGRFTTEEDIIKAANELIEVVSRIRKISSI